MNVCNIQKNCGLDDSIFFLNHLDNYHVILGKAKVLLVIDTLEETPIYALESEALGVPVLSVYSNAFKNIVQNEYNGFLANNDFDLANFLARMLDDRNLWLLLSTNALSQSYNINNTDTYLEDLKKLYDIEKGEPL